MSKFSPLFQTFSGCVGSVHYFKVFVCLLFFNTLIGIQGVGANVLGSEEELVRLKEQAIYYLSKKQPDRAYETLKPAELVYAGDAQYNYLLGMAAIDSGHPEDASWAFERVVAVMPHHAGARMDMARAFFQLKDYPRAEKEFQLLQAMNPPESAQKAIAFYLAEIDRLSDRHPKWILTGSAYSAVGYSSNATGAPSEDNYIAAFAEMFSMTEDTVRQLYDVTDGEFEAADGFIDLGVSGVATYKRPGPWSFYAAPTLSRKTMFSKSDYSSLSLGAKLGGRWKEKKSDLNGYLQYSAIEQSGGSSISVQTAMIDYGYLLNSRSRLGGQVSWAGNSYQDSPSNNSQTTGISIYGSYIFGQYRPFVLQTQISVSNDEAINNRTDGDKDLLGVSVFGQYIFNQEHIFFGSVNFMESNFTLKRSLYNSPREDTQIAYGLGYLWQVNKAIGVKTQINHTETTSNIALYDSAKQDASVRLNYSF